MKSTLTWCSRIALLCCLPAITGCDLFKKSSTSPSDTPQTVTLVGGSGYIFEGAKTSTDDRDLWWNGVSMIPSTGIASTVKMSFLGQTADLAAMTDLKIATMTSEQRFPQAGEAFALEIKRPFDAQPRYALIRVTSISPALALEYFYPR
jgi:hypothetical protein